MIDPGPVTESRSSTDPKLIEQSWPEHAPPPGVAVDCNTFGMEGHGRFVWGEGDPAAEVVCILDNPGAREDKEGVPFLCGTRQTLRQAAAEAGLDPARLYVTYLVKCRPLRAYDKNLAWSTGRRVLEEQLRAMAPRVLALFGDVVVKALTGDEAASARALRGDSPALFGIPTVVSYHPLAARRRPNLYPLIVEDLRRLS